MLSVRPGFTMHFAMHKLDSTRHQASPPPVTGNVEWGGGWLLDARHREGQRVFTGTGVPQ